MVLFCVLACITDCCQGYVVLRFVLYVYCKV